MFWMNAVAEFVLTVYHLLALFGTLLLLTVLAVQAVYNPRGEVMNDRLVYLTIPSLHPLPSSGFL